MNGALLMKEIRALLPMWAACLITLAGGYLQQRGVLMELSVAVFVAAPALLGAHAIGHEYSYRTLPAVLAQPVARRTLFLAKWSIAAVMSLVLVAVSTVVLKPYALGMWERWTVSILPLVGGLLVAPWFAMLMRSTLASALATGTLFGMALMLPAIIIAILTGRTVDAVQDQLLAPWSYAMIAFSGLSIVVALAHVNTLEAGDANARAFTLPRLGRGGERHFRPLAALAGKELQLQQLTIALAALFIVLSVFLVILQRTIASWYAAPIGAVMALYCMLLSLVIGAMASAEERQLGVAEWQLIQPASAGTQWAVKVAVALGLATMLAAALPSLLVKLAVNPGETFLFQTLILPTIFLTTAALYLSSFSNSGTWALVLTLPAIVGAGMFIRFLDDGPLAITGRAMSTLTPVRPLSYVVIPLLLWLGFLNHSRIDRSRGALIWQVAAIGAVIVVSRYVAMSL